MSDTLKGFCEDVIAQRETINHETITDEIFFLIQNDRKLMHLYLRLVEEKGLDQVNQTIGRAVKVRFDLTNDVRQHHPKSTLIQSYQEFL